MKIAEVIEAINANRIRVTDHADEEANADRLTLDEIIFSTVHGEIIEDYPHDKPYASCLIYGQTEKQEPVHSVWAYNEKSKSTVLITVYRPEPKRWVNWKQRRKNQ